MEEHRLNEYREGNITTITHGALPGEATLTAREMSSHLAGTAGGHQTQCGLQDEGNGRRL